MPKFVATPGIVRVLTEVKCKYELSKLLFCYSVENTVKEKSIPFLTSCILAAIVGCSSAFSSSLVMTILRGVPVEFSAGNGDFTAVGTV